MKFDQDNITGELPDQLSGATEAYRLIAKSAYESASQSEFYHYAMNCVGTLFNSPCCSMYVNMNAEVFDDYSHTGSINPEFWRPIVQDSLNDTIEQAIGSARFFNSKNPDKAQPVAVLSALIYSGAGAATGAIALATASWNKEQATMQLKLLESLASMISCLSEVSKQKFSELDDKYEACKRLAQAANYSNRHELAYAITNNLRNRTGCDQVAFGHVKSGQVELLSVSGLSELRKRNVHIVSIQDAMEECLDFDKTITYQLAGDNKDNAPMQYRLHRKWHESARHAAVASVPLHGPDGVQAILSLKRQGTKPFSAEELDEVRSLAEPYIAVFGVIEKAHRNLLQHSLGSVKQLVAATLKPEKWTKKAIIAATAIFTCWFVFGSIDYHVTISGRIIPQKTQHISNPQTMVLAESAVQPGDIVKAGDILCRFNTDALDLIEREKLLSELKIAQIQARNAQGKNDAVGAKLAEANLELIQTKLAILDRQVEQATMRAPFDGIVIKGDLSKRIGEVIPQSEPLFEIAALGGWQAQLEASEIAAADLAEGQMGVFITNAKPDIAGKIKLINICPGAELYNNRNVYIADAELDLSESWLKAGMEGVGKVNVGRKRVYRAVFQKIINYAYLNFWL